MFDVSHMRGQGIRVANLHFDTMVAHHLVRNYLPHDLNTLISIYTDMDKYDDGIKEYLPNKTTKFSAIPQDVLYRYGAHDAFAVMQIMPKLIAELEEHELLEYFHKQLMPLLDVCIELRFRGVKIDLASSRHAAIEMDKDIASTETAIFELAGEQLNLNSSKQLTHLLYNVLKLPCKHRTKTGAPSANKAVLEELKDQHAMIPKLLHYRKISKVRSTFLSDKFLHRVEADPEHRIHTEYKVTGTATSRLSSENPNLQNIPRGSAVRTMFVAEDGYLFATVDYSQAELRVAAYLSKDPTMTQMFDSGEDIHRLTASQILRKDPKLIDYEERILA